MALVSNMQALKNVPKHEQLLFLSNTSNKVQNLQITYYFYLITQFLLQVEFPGKHPEISV